MKSIESDPIDFLGLRRSGAAAPPLDRRPVGSMVLWGASLGLLSGLPLALVLHHPWTLLPWSAVIALFLYLGRDPEPLPRDLGIPEPLETPRQPAPVSETPDTRSLGGPEPPETPKYREPEPLVDLIDIPAGQFRMGSPEDEQGRYGTEGPQRRVEVPDFRMMRTLVTRRLYRTYMDQIPEEWGTVDTDGELPADRVSWYDAARFCNALSVAEGLEPSYRIEGEDSVTLSPGADGYRLPTEAEWEYSCRAGTTTAWSFGSDASDIGKYAWYSGNSGGEPHPVAEKRPNPWGLHDIHGNLWEWVEDCWHGNYRGAPTDGSAWVDQDCSARVVRGGSFFDSSRVLRSADRGGFRPGNWDFDLGFRCVRSLSPGMGPLTD